jgi:pimeloyl-ACP methyl ester carboxylesterase
MGTPAYVRANGIRMAVWEQGQGFPVVMCHGFPELAFSWRHQLPALAGAGWRAIAPDQRGYGLSHRPPEVAAYDMAHLTGDLVGLLDALGIERAVFCGHDWGGWVAWQMPLLHPERVAGVIALNTPYFPRGPLDLVEATRRARGEDNYIVAFQRPGLADEWLARDIPRFFDRMLRRPTLTQAEFARQPASVRNLTLRGMAEGSAPRGEPAVDAEALRVYGAAFQRTGFTGGINWYRNIRRNWEQGAALPTRIEVPCLMISAAQDVYLPPGLTHGMEAHIRQLEKHVIEDCGHWTQQERPEETNRIVLDWLRRTFRPVRGLLLR